MKKTSLRLLTMLLAAMMSVGYVSCGGDDGGSGTAGGNGTGGSGSGSKPNPDVTYSVYINTSGLTADNFLFFDYKYSISDFTASDQAITQPGELLVLEGKKGADISLTIKVTAKAGLESLIDRDATYSLAPTDLITIRIVSSDGQTWKTGPAGVIVTKTGSYLLANLGYFTGQRTFSLNSNGLEESGNQQQQELLEVYDYYLDTSSLTADNFTFFDYTVTVEGSPVGAYSITGAASAELFSNQLATDRRRVIVAITPKSNVSTLVDKAKAYSLADYRAIKLRSVASDGSTVETPATVNIVTNNGRYLLANLDYFCNTLVFDISGGSSSVTAQNTQPALQDPGIEITEGDAIDLGLSVYWASSNIVVHQQVYGQNYYAWGETSAKNDYTWNTYKFFNGSYFTKYYSGVDNKLIMDLTDDVANVVKGGNWRMPTKAEMEELLNNCTWEWVTYLGFPGYKVTGRNGNSIFLGTYGYLGQNTIELYGQSLENHRAGYYWTKELWSATGQYAYQLGTALKIAEGEHFLTSERGRYHGCTVRAVLPK